MTTPSFGQRSNVVADARSRMKDGPSRVEMPKIGKRRTWKDYAFWGFVILMGLSVVGNVGRMLEDPEVRNARLLEEARAAALAEHNAKVAKAQRDAEAEKQRKKAAADAKEAAKIAALPKLRVNSFKCSKEHGFAKVTGTVTNRTNVPMDRLMVVALFSSSNGEFIKSADAMVDYQPLMPGQTSPFMALTSDNPMMRNCEVQFKEMFGGVVSSGR